jgi:integrase
VFCPRLADPAHGSWSIDVTVPGAFGVGPPVRVRRGGYRTRQAAQAALDEVVGRAHGDAAGAAWTVQRWLGHWLATLPGIRPATRSSYEAHVRVHLSPTLGRARLDELTPPMVQAAFTRIAATWTRTGQPLSPATVRRVHATLRAALNAALRDGLIATNPAWHTRLPLAQPVHPEVWTPGRVAIWQTTGEHPTVAVWTPDQLATFLNQRRQAQDPLYPAWRLIALRGLRRGEACGLRWADLDLDPADDQPIGGTTAGGHGRLRVVQALVQIGGHISPAPPKTPASRRTISLDPATTTLLRDLRTAAATRAGGRLDPTSPVLADQAGHPIQPQRLSVAFRRVVQASGLPPVRLHDLRHGAASLALAAGADLKTVQDLLGHSTIITTADIYTSVLPEVHDRYADAVADLVHAAQQRHPHPQY